MNQKDYKKLEARLLTQSTSVKKSKQTATLLLTGLGLIKTGVIGGKAKASSK